MASLHELLRDTLRGLPPSPQSLDPAQRPWALHSGMVPLLCASFAPTQGSDGLSADAISQWPGLEAASLQAKLRTHQLRATLSEVLGAVLPELGSPLVLLKGAATSLEYYPAPHLRPMRDLDLLLQREDMEAFEATLTSLGYRPDSHNPAEYYVDHHHGMPFLDTGRNVSVEPHTDLFPSRDVLSRSRAFSPTTWQQELRETTFDSHRVSCFSPEYQLLHTACHWSQHLEPWSSLPGLIDISLILRRHAAGLDWHRVQQWLDEPAVRARAVPVIAFLEAHDMIQLAATPGGAIMRRGVRRLGRSSVALQHRMIYRFCFEGASPGRLLNRNNSSQLWESLSLPGGPLTRLARSTWHVAFPPTAPDRFSPRFQWARLRRALGSAPRE